MGGGALEDRKKKRSCCSETPKSINAQRKIEKGRIRQILELRSSNILFLTGGVAFGRCIFLESKRRGGEN